MKILFATHAAFPASPLIPALAFLASFALSSSPAAPGDISTFAGTGSPGGYNGDNQPATTAALSGPGITAVDAAANVFIASSVVAHPDSLDPCKGAVQPPLEIPPGAPLQKSSSGPPRIRMGYVVPSNRTAQVNAVPDFQLAMTRTRDWYRDQMTAHGYPDRVINLETEADGVTPLIHVVNIPETDDYLRGDVWGRTITAAQNAGLSIWTRGEVWILIPEEHLQNSDGTTEGNLFGGTTTGSGDDPGVAMVTGNALALFKYLGDDRLYDGLILPEIGPYPLDFGEGDTLSSVSSIVHGALMHEFGHALGLFHDFRNDSNFHGNLTGNGFRGVRGNIFPASYPSDETWLTRASALLLATSRYLGGSSDENNPPTVSVLTSGRQSISNGLLRVAFTASDDSGLSAAILNSEIGGSNSWVAEMKLSGTNFSGSFRVPHFEEGERDTYRVEVFDIHGNKQGVNTQITVAAGSNRAPKAHFRVSRSIGLRSESVTLDASGSSDPDGGTLKFEWDLDGDGVFDTPPSSQSTYALDLDTPGLRSVSVRVTDPEGASSVSAPLLVETHRPSLDVSITPSGMVRVSWKSRLGFVYEPTGTGDLDFSSPEVFPDQYGNGGEIGFSDDSTPSGRYFYRHSLSRRSHP